MAIEYVLVRLLFLYWTYIATGSGRREQVVFDFFKQKKIQPSCSGVVLLTETFQRHKSMKFIIQLKMNQTRFF